MTGVNMLTSGWGGEGSPRREAANAAASPAEVRRRWRQGKPLAWRLPSSAARPMRAADRGGMGWAILDLAADPPRLDWGYTPRRGRAATGVASMTADFGAR